MNSTVQAENFIKSIDTCLKYFTPKDPYTLINTNDYVIGKVHKLTPNELNG